MKAREARAVKAAALELRNQGRLPEALALIRDTPGADEQPRLMNAYADLLRINGDPEELERFLRSALGRDPGNTHLLSHFLMLNERIPQSLEKIAVARAAAENDRTPASWGRLAALLMTRDEFDAAWDAAMEALAVTTAGLLSDPVRDLVAGLFTNYGQDDLAEALMLRRTFSHPMEGLWVLARLRRRIKPDEATRAMLSALAEVGSPFRKEAREVFFDFCWSIDGPSPELLDRAAAWEQERPQDRLRLQRIGMSLELEQAETARALLAERPEIARYVRSLLPLASLIRTTLGTRCDLDGSVLDEQMALETEIKSASTDLLRELSDFGRSVAIVGNSACESGLAKGTAIDGHDIVIRFNKGASQPGFAVDYGSKTDVHVLPLRKETRGLPATGARYVLFTSPSAFFRNRDWSVPQHFSRLGKRPVCLGNHNYAALVSKLRAPPSNGLRVASVVSRLRPAGTTNAYGFSFVDQLGPGAASSHYYEAARPSMHHNWHRERQVFAELFPPRPAERA